MLILIGPSASGKTEIAKYLMKNFHLKKLVTTTSRQIRLKEQNNIDYHFVSKDQFLKMIDENKFVEFAIYNNNYYGTEKREISDNKCVILEPNGAKKLKELNNNFFAVFISCSEKIRRQRMINRGDKIDDIEKRIILDGELFNIQNLDFIDLIVKSDDSTIETLATLIYKKYQEKLNNQII